MNEFWIDAGHTHAVHSGIGVQIPSNHFGHLLPQSSLAAKGTQIMGGIIDSDYVGEIIIQLHNISKESIHFLDRMAQLIIVPYKTVHWEQIDKSSNVTTRKGGFGSTTEKPGSKVWVKKTPC